MREVVAEESFYCSVLPFAPPMEWCPHDLILEIRFGSKLHGVGVFGVNRIVD